MPIRFVLRGCFLRKWDSNCYHIQTSTFLPKLRLCHSVSGSDHGVELSKEQQTVPGRQITTKPGRERQVSQLILDHFDLQYSKELGPLWSSARGVLLNPRCWQYGVMLNRFTSVADVKQRLQSQGFTSLLPQPETLAALPGHAPTPLGPASPPRDAPRPDDARSRLFQSDPLPPHPCPDPSSHHHLPDPDRPPGPPPPLASPPSLQCLVHASPVRLPSQRHRPGRLKQYYLLNAASLLPVLALGVSEGDRVLDLCSAPGGKALAILQTANPAVLRCNEVDPHRRDWLAKTLESFLPQALSDTVTVCNQDGRTFGQSEAGMYDKVLVDAPCSNDRSWMFSPPGQQGGLRLRERNKLPRLQKELLWSALGAVRPGGVVVYSTCTLSRAENQDVVAEVLSSFPGAELQDLGEELLTAALSPLLDHFALAPLGDAPPGLLVVPQPGRTWGPMFVSRIKRTH